jgi:hypothetical protein
MGQHVREVRERMVQRMLHELVVLREQWVLRMLHEPLLDQLELEQPKVRERWERKLRLVCRDEPLIGKHSLEREDLVE